MQAGRIVGVLQAINRLVDPDEGLDREDTVTAKATPTATRYPFTDMDVSVLEILAAHAGSALKKAALLAEIVSVETLYSAPLCWLGVSVMCMYLRKCGPSWSDEPYASVVETYCVL